MTKTPAAPASVAPTEAAPLEPALTDSAPPRAQTLTSQQKAAIIIGVLGPAAAGPLLERLDDTALRNFTQTMSKLKCVGSAEVARTITEFLDALEAAQDSVRGGVQSVRELLEPMMEEAELNRLLDEADAPSVSNVWQKLAKVDEDALADFLLREHPQTAAVVLSKLNAEHAAKVLSRIPPERARDMVMGIARTSSLDPHVIEAIGGSVSRDFLASHQHNAVRRDPAERVGAIMNFTKPETREQVLNHLGEAQPEFADEVKRRMFTFEDVPKRVPQRGVSTLAGLIEREVLLKAMAGPGPAARDARSFFLSNLAARVASQFEEGLEEIGEVNRAECEAAQNEVLRTIRELDEKGEINLVNEDDQAGS